MKIERITGWLAGRANELPGPLSPRLRNLLQRYEHVPLEEVFSWNEPDPGQGTDRCLILDKVASVPCVLPPGEEAVGRMLADLTLLRGVGTRYRQQLHEQGFGTIRELADHPRWGNRASQLIASWGNPVDPTCAYRTLCRWLPASDPLFLQLLGTVPQERILFFDLETLGLTQAPIFLAATGQWTDEGFLVRQYFASTLSAEVDLLERLTDALDHADALISYNGKSFDWTMIRDRLGYYGFPPRKAPIHVDLLHHARSRYRFADHHLATMETHVLGIERTGDVPSAQVPEYYTTFLETGNPGPLVPIIEHNRQDIITLGHLLNRMLSHGN